ncbi:MAG: hypothetical protein WBG37_08400, partial [Desulfobacterales bacterium]
MNELFILLEQLVSLTTPTLLILQNLLGITLISVPNENEHWHFYKSRIDTGLISQVEYREPGKGATKPSPFLVLKLRDASIRIDDLSKRYGRGYPTDVSIHHPHFVGYTFSVNGCKIGVNADSKTNAVLSISIDYSLQ